MPKFKTVDDLKKYSSKKDENEVQILVGMGTCGIAAGSNKVIKKFEELAKIRGLENVTVKQVGCLGLCFSEPNVEIVKEGLPEVLYGKVDEKFAVRIFDEHVIDAKIINERIYDKPYIDILKT